MKTIRILGGIISIFLFTQISYSQSGWVQTQLNGYFGYNLIIADSLLFAATNDGAFSTSSDGMPWFSKGPEGKNVYDIIQNGQYILAAANDGIYRSLDNGNSWQLASNSPTFSGTGANYGPNIFARNNTYVFAISTGQGFFRSADNGSSWQKMSLGTRSGTSGDLGEWARCIAAAEGKVFVGIDDMYPLIYMTDNNGESWASKQISTEMTGHIINILYNNDGKLFASGFSGVYMSTDLGISWNTQYSNHVDQNGQLIGLGTFRDMAFYNNLLIAAVDFHSIQISDDYGKTWSGFNEGLISDWTFASIIIKPPDIWAITYFFGNAYRRSVNEITTGIVPASGSVPGEYSLMQNYPNPFNPETTIAYSIPEASHVKLKIYDVLGHEIAVQVNGYKTAGNHSEIFSAHNLPSGIYFCRLEAGDYSSVKKMILLK